MKTVSILLSTYNGEKYLKQQLDSLLKQEGVKTQIFVRDDGSKDGTVEILRQYEKDSHITLTVGENLGFSKSFSWLINNAPKADYYSCCDQDDVWLPHKVVNAVTELEKHDVKTPLMYYTNFIVVDENLKEITRKSHEVLSKQSNTLFQESLLMTMANGCTVVFNNALHDLYVQIPVYNIYAHDYTLNTLASCFGKVCFESNPQILYRQHSNNCYGFYKGSLKNLIRSVRLFFKYEVKSIRTHEALIYQYYFYDKLNRENKEFIDLMVRYKIDRKKKKALLKYLRRNIKNKTIRNYSLILARFKKL